jgi:hypothetical protein
MTYAGGHWYDLIEYKREGEHGLILPGNENAILFQALLANKHEK